MAKLIQYKNTNFKSVDNKPILIEESFASKLDTVNELAKKHKLTVIVTSSYRENTNVKGAIVTPAKMGNHLIGHAIDCNLQSQITGEYFNSKKMGDGTGLDQPFLMEVDLHSQLRWGGNFNTKDEVHIDDGLNIINPNLWKKIYTELHD